MLVEVQRGKEVVGSREGQLIAPLSVIPTACLHNFSILYVSSALPYRYYSILMCPHHRSRSIHLHVLMGLLTWNGLEQLKDYPIYTWQILIFGKTWKKLLQHYPICTWQNRMFGKKRANWLKFGSVGSAWHPAYAVGPTHLACTLQHHACSCMP